MSPLSYRAAFLKSLVCSWAKTSPQFPTDITRMAQTDPVRKQDSDSDLADKGVHAAWYERFSEIKLGSWRMTPENRQIQLICNFGLGTKWKYFWKEKKKVSCIPLLYLHVCTKTLGEIRNSRQTTRLFFHRMTMKKLLSDLERHDNWYWKEKIYWLWFGMRHVVLFFLFFFLLREIFCICLGFKKIITSWKEHSPDTKLSLKKVACKGGGGL